MKKSIITCDLEGTILTMNNVAEEIFGYKKEELINKKRVSIFSPGEIVLQNVESWLSTAVKNGEYLGETIFINKKQEQINAKIKITPTFQNGKDGKHIGYCGITEKIDKNIHVKIKPTTKIIKWLAITRMPFTTASLLPIICVSTYLSSTGSNVFDTVSLTLCILGIILAHLGSNLFNDYFDNIDGTDEGNNDYFQQLSGGSRAIELGLINLKGTRNLGIIFILIALCLLIGILMFANKNNINGILITSIIGLFLGFFYTAPPIRLVSRNGLGELAIFLAFGPLLTLGTGFAIFNGNFVESNYFIDCILIGIPLGLLTTNILMINQFPDMKSDIKTGKNHLVATFGKNKSIYIYIAIYILSIISSIILGYELNNRYIYISTLFILISSIYLSNYLGKFYNSRKLIKANWLTIHTHTIFSIILIISFLI